eukprot:jgi/Chrzof1/6503/Cz18g13210.t1
MEGYWIVFGFTWSRVQLYSGSASEAAGAAATVSSSKTTSCNLNVVALHFWARQISEGLILVRRSAGESGTLQQHTEPPSLL